MAEIRVAEERRALLRVVVPGAAMIAVTFGLARYGYGLLLPEMQADLGLDARTGGLIASGAYLSYLLGNTAVVGLTSRFGPGPPLTVAAATAAAGMVVIATADGPMGLAVGVLVAGASAGFAFPPYADVVAHAVAPARRSTAWSTISSGTGWGVALAGPVAVALGADWRAAWLVFAGVAVVVGVVAVLAAPGRVAGRGVRGRPAPPRVRWSWVLCPRSRPLLIGAVLLGAGSSVWWTFSVDALRAAGTPETPARVVYAVCGAASVLASATGVVVVRAGLRRAHLLAAGVLVASLGLLALTRANVVVALVAAVLFGVSYAAAVAVQGLWSAEVFADRPSAGLAAVNTALTVGTIAGPPVAGVLVATHGYGVALGAAAAVTALAAVQVPPQRRAALAARASP